MAEEKKKLDEIRIKPADPKDGKFHGMTVEHHFKAAPMHSSKSGMGSRYVEPESHVFGVTEGHHALAHLANHLHIPAESPEEREGGEDEDGEGEGEE